MNFWSLVVMQLVEATSDPYWGIGMPHCTKHVTDGHTHTQTEKYCQLWWATLLATPFTSSLGEFYIHTLYTSENPLAVKSSIYLQKATNSFVPVLLYM